MWTGLSGSLQIGGMDPRWRRWRTSWRKLPLLSLPPISQLFPQLPPNLHPSWPTSPKIKFPASNCHVPILIVYSNSPFIFICKCTFLYTLRLEYDFEKCKNKTKYAFTLKSSKCWLRCSSAMSFSGNFLTICKHKEERGPKVLCCNEHGKYSWLVALCVTDNTYLLFVPDL